MTQPTAAVGGEATPVEPTDPEEIYEQFGEEVFGKTDEEPAEGDLAEEADDELDIEEEADDPPPIEAPVSWDAEAKEVFNNLPREAQEIVQKREAQREQFVQAKSQEAARAAETARQEALQRLAQIEAGYAQSYNEFAASQEVAAPDPMLQVTDPVAYAQQMRAVQQANAQRSRAQQEAQQHYQQAQALAYQAEQQNQAAQHAIIVDRFPEYADPTTGPELQRKLTTVAKELGYPDELITQARAPDILAMRTAADWKAKADKYDALQAKKMEKVRSAKGLPKVATPGVAQGASQLSARTAQAALEVAKNSKNRNVQGAAFFDYLKNSGQI